ncbi:MAG: cytidylate kinase-like family protein [Lachnospiraceae bacterium]|nr:cytidylate kinase-like family protein [Lachnospiraceae bacterium]
MEKQKLIITIGRQYGSGGADIGKALGKKLGLHVYDKEILKMTSDESGIRESYFHLADERAGNKLLYRVVQSLIPENGAPSLGSDLVSADNLFRFQSAVIRRLAQEESCIFIGRCADYVLAGTENMVRVFVYADMEARVKRITEKGYYADDEVHKNIRRIDRERRDYHRYYTGKDWEGLGNYDLMLNSSVIGVAGCVACILDYLKIRGLS